MWQPIASVARALPCLLCLQNGTNARSNLSASDIFAGPDLNIDLIANMGGDRSASTVQDRGTSVVAAVSA